MGKSQELMSLDNSVINDIIQNLYQFCQRKAHITRQYIRCSDHAGINKFPNTFINDKSTYVCGLVVKTPLQY